MSIGERATGGLDKVELDWCHDCGLLSIPTAVVDVDPDASFVPLDEPKLGLEHAQ